MTDVVTVEPLAALIGDAMEPMRGEVLVVIFIRTVIWKPCHECASTNPLAHFSSAWS
jgi:hypothetical protein